MNGITWDQSPITGVVAAENAWGTLTTLYTSKMPWKGFRVISQSQDTYYTSFIQIYAGSAPIGPDTTPGALQANCTARADAKTSYELFLDDVPYQCGKNVFGQDRYVTCVKRR